jgi:chloramphenicol 3-O phosphotransferase
MSDMPSVDPPAAPGRVVVLNGASSSGRTSLARALQFRGDGPLLEAGLDRCWAGGPYPDAAPRWRRELDT